MKQQHRPAAKVSTKRLRRAVASSTAIETGRPVTEIESRLDTPPERLKHLKLAH